MRRKRKKSRGLGSANSTHATRAGDHLSYAESDLTDAAEALTCDTMFEAIKESARHLGHARAHIDSMELGSGPSGYLNRYDTLARVYNKHSQEFTARCLRKKK